MLKSIYTASFLFALLCLDHSVADSANGSPPSPISDAVVARQLVHQSNYAAVGSNSKNEKIIDYPMANVLAVDDSTVNGSSTGRIHFLLADFTFTGADVLQNNKTTFFFREELGRACNISAINPMELACPRVIISGRVKKLDTKSPEYEAVIQAFNNRHKNAKILIQEFNFYLNELEIDNIFFVAFERFPSIIAVEDFYNAQL